MQLLHVYLYLLYLKLFPIPDEVNRKIDIALIGKNQLTIPIVQNLTSQLYNITLFYRKDLGDQRNLPDNVTVIEISEYEESLLETWLI